MKQDRPLSYSALKQFDISPNHLIAYWNRDLTQSSAQIKGTLIHHLVLEPDTFDEKYAIFEGKVKRGKAYDEFVENNVGKTIISQKDYDDANTVKAAVFNNDSVHDMFLKTHTTEEVVEWARGKNRFKSIIDGRGDDFIFDLKTTASADPKKFTNDAFKYGYAMQAAMYCMAAGVESYYIIAVESGSPYNVTLFKMSDELIQYGVSEFNRIVENYNNWDGKPVGYSDVVESLDFPEWFKKQRELVDIF
jgi:hypothetical protein